MIKIDDVVSDDYVTCFSDGWGAESLKYSSADVIVKQWILSPFDLHTDYAFTLKSGDATTGRMSSILPIDLDKYLVSVQARFSKIYFFSLDKIIRIQLK